MLAEKEYYDIVIRDNCLDEVTIIDEDKYNYFSSIFNYVYHTKNGETYQLHKNLDAGIDMLIVDGEHLYELLDDLRKQGFCDGIDFDFIDDYLNGELDLYLKAF